MEKDPHITLSPLEDLRKFLAQELDSILEHNVELSDAFVPLTDGLGFKDIKKKEHSIGLEEETSALPSLRGGMGELMGSSTSKEIRDHRRDVVPRPTGTSPQDIFSYQEPSSSLLSNTKEKSVEPIVEFQHKANPPLLPQASYVRRICAAIVDYLLVGSLSLGIIYMTIQGFYLLDDSSRHRDIKYLLQLVSEPFFIRSLAIEVLSVCLLYFVISLFLWDRTMGMWVWSLKVGYSGDRLRDGNRSIWKRIKRIFFTLFFFVSGIGNILLVIKIRGKNLLDFLSSSYVFRVV